MNLITINVQLILFEYGFYDLKVVEVDSNITMVYEITTDEIRLNPLVIEEYLARNEISFDEIAVLHAMTVHELGHYIEFKKNPSLIEKAKYHHLNGTFEEYKKFHIEREMNAWLLGKEIIKQEYIDVFDELNEINMRNYRNMELKEL